MDISLIIPAHNEENRLALTLNRYSEAMWRWYRSGFEIVVVTNGCQDQTAQVAQNFAASCDQIKVIDIPQPIGKGGAVVEGFRQASGDSVLFTDADGATSPASLHALLEALDVADIAIGSRWLRSSRVLHKQPIQRRVCSRLFNLSVRSLFGLPYHDTQCGAKAFRRAPAKKLAAVVKESRWTFDVDLLLWACFFHLSVVEVPVEWADQPGSKLEIGSTCREVAASLWKMKRAKRQLIWENSPWARTNRINL